MTSVRTISPSALTSPELIVATAPQGSVSSSPTNPVDPHETGTLIPEKITLNKRPVLVGSFTISKDLDNVLLAVLLKPQGKAEEVNAPVSSQKASGVNDKWYRYYCTFETFEKVASD